MMQYEEIMSLPAHESDKGNVHRSIVRHKYTRKKFLCKSVNLKHGVFDKSKVERTVLLLCKKHKLKTISVYDCFDTQNMYYMILEHPKGISLRDSISKLGNKYLKEKEAKRIVF